MSHSTYEQYIQHQSIKGLKWYIYQQDENIIAMFMRQLSISEFIARMLYNRNARTLDDALTLLKPKIKDLLPDPRTMLDMHKATARVIRALNNEEKITIFADYDVDGATSGSLLKKFFRAIGEEIDIYIPNRFTEGYGPNNNAFDKIKHNGTSLVIIVDCGSVAFEPLLYAKKIGLDIIVIDHHITNTTLPHAVALLNPNRYDETFEPKSIAAVTVTFLFLVALRTELRIHNWFNDKYPEPNLMNYLDVVALGTICDLMPLTPLNRALVKHGLELIKNGSNYGISALLNTCKIHCTLQSHHLGYTVGPRINAGGRLDDSTLGFKLLTATTPQEANLLALTLETLNAERKTLEALILNEAINNIDRNKINTIVVTIGTEWHQGVLGIIASKLKEDFYKPTLVISIDTTKQFAKGSIRSITGVDAAIIIHDAKKQELILEGGGHPMAGGFSLNVNNIQSFIDFVEQKVTEMLINTNVLQEVKKIIVDGIISISSVTVEFLNEILQLDPFGINNPKPYFIIENIIITHMHHSKGIFFLQIESIFDNKSSLKCLCFANNINNIAIFLKKYQKEHISILGTIQANNLLKDKVNFIIEDIYYNVTY